MERLRIEGFVVIEDCFECDGERLLAALALKTGRDGPFSITRVLLFSSARHSFIKKYSALLRPNITISEIEIVADIPKLLGAETLSIKPANDAVFIDTATHLLSPQNFDDTVKQLKFIAQCGRAVVVRVFSESLSSALRKRLHCAADVLLKLSKFDKNTALCRFTYSVKSGRRKTKTETFDIDDHLKITALNSQDIASENVDRDNDYREFSNVPFDLGLRLSNTELEAKNSLRLPYLAAQRNSGHGVRLIGERKVRAGGRIIYTPDDRDDFDGSDPDDDLEV